MPCHPHVLGQIPTGKEMKPICTAFEIRLRHKLKLSKFQKKSALKVLCQLGGRNKDEEHRGNTETEAQNQDRAPYGAGEFPG